MPGSTYIPSREVDLLHWSRNFDARINEDPQAIGLSTEQAEAYSVAHAAYDIAYRNSQDPSTRTPSAIQSKNDTKKALLVEIRRLVPIIQSFAGVMNERRKKLGITVRSQEHSPIPKPGAAPGLRIVYTIGRRAKIRLRDIGSPDRRGKPEGVNGALVYMYVGDTAPTNPAEWTLIANVTHTIFNLHFPAAVEAGAKVWLAASWYNTKAKSGPPSASVSLRISDGVAKAA